MKIDIGGDPTPEVAAAVTAVIARLIHEAHVEAAKPSQSPRPSSWVQSWKSHEQQTPVMPGGDVEPWQPFDVHRDR